jgi:hypothetical protein
LLATPLFPADCPPRQFGGCFAYDFADIGHDDLEMRRSFDATPRS